MRVLITGGTGFVGQHLIEFLKSRASHIAVLAIGKSQIEDPELEYHEVDIRDPDKVSSVVRQVKPGQIYHLAGISVVDVSLGDPRLTYEVNVFGAYNLLVAASRLSPPPKILNVSTSQVYAPSSRPLTEESPMCPESPYAASKAMAEILVVPGLPRGMITARAFNHTGRGQTAKFVLPSIAKQFAEMKSGKSPRKIVLGDVGVKRDFTDVRDVVRAYWTLLESGATPGIYNVCSGRAVSLQEILGIFQSVAEMEVTLESDPLRARANDPPSICGDSTKLREATGWRPRFSLGETIVDLLDYWRSGSATPYRHPVNQII